MQDLQHGLTTEETTRFKAKWMQFIRKIIKELCILVYRHDLRRQGLSERAISAKATGAGRQMSGVGIRDICNRTSDTLQYGHEELRTLIDAWERISSHPSERMICGSIHTSLKTIELMARLETRPSKLMDPAATRPSAWITDS